MSDKIYQNDVNLGAFSYISVSHINIRLVNGSGIPTQGRIEIQINGKWGTVCDNEFDDKDAAVFCSMMGFSR